MVAMVNLLFAVICIAAGTCIVTFKPSYFKIKPPLTKHDSEIELQDLRIVPQSK